MIVSTLSGYAQDADIGKQEYFMACATCHGQNGRGDGPLVPWLKKSPADLTKIQKNNKGVFPFERLYNVIDGREEVAAHGPRDMFVWGNVYRREAEILGFRSPEARTSYTRGRIIALIGYLSIIQEK